MQKHYTIRVSGTVQGVFFRKSTKETADELQLKGFVRNEKDGSVYIEAEGNEDALQKLVEWCHKGPGRASVDKVEVKEGSPKGFREFEVRR